MNPPFEVINSDCLEALSEFPDASIDAVITDPPYPEISRPYGRMTEAEWHKLMEGVIHETRRILKPEGSAVFILQPNSKHVGEMRLWLWEFLLKTAREWNLIQDVYQWNFSSPPNVHCQRTHGLMRPSVKYCLWFGDPDCYRNQEEILWAPSKAMEETEKAASWELRTTPSGYSTRNGRIMQSVKERGGVTPFNLIPVSNGFTEDCAGSHGHGAGTPLKLCEWWTRYIVPPGGHSLDMFAGTGTTGVAAVSQAKQWTGIDLPGFFGPNVPRKQLVPGSLLKCSLHTPAA